MLKLLDVFFTEEKCIVQVVGAVKVEQTFSTQEKEVNFVPYYFKQCEPGLVNKPFNSLLYKSVFVKSSNRALQLSWFNSLRWKTVATLCVNRCISLISEASLSSLHLYLE